MAAVLQRKEEYNDGGSGNVVITLLIRYHDILSQ